VLWSKRAPLPFAGFVSIEVESTILGLPGIAPQKWNDDTEQIQHFYALIVTLRIAFEAHPSPMEHGVASTCMLHQNK